MNAMAWGLVSPVSVCLTLLRRCWFSAMASATSTQPSTKIFWSIQSGAGFPSRISRTAWRFLVILQDWCPVRLCCIHYRSHSGGL